MRPALLPLARKSSDLEYRTLTFSLLISANSFVSLRTRQFPHPFFYVEQNEKIISFRRSTNASAQVSLFPVDLRLWLTHLEPWIRVRRVSQGLRSRLG